MHTFCIFIHYTDLCKMSFSFADRFEKCRSLRTVAWRICGIFNIASGVDFSILCKKRRTDFKSRIRYIGIFKRRKSFSDQLLYTVAPSLYFLFFPIFSYQATDCLNRSFYWKFRIMNYRIVQTFFCAFLVCHHQKHGSYPHAKITSYYI